MSLHALRFAARHYRNAASPAVAYLGGRGISAETCAAFGVGFAREGWTHLLDAASAAGLPEADLLAAGLCARSKRKEGGVYDRLRGRVTFPIISPLGKTLGFGGRILPHLEAPRAPKYLNSPETTFYKKRRTLYGAYQARTAIRETKEAVVCEGYTDVLALWEAGVRNAVAVCGTALTDEHVHALTRLGADKLTLYFDGDSAGRAAARSAVETAVPFVRGVRVMPTRDGEDPASRLAEEGAAALASGFTRDQDWIEWLLPYDEADPWVGGLQAVDDAIEAFSWLPEGIARADALAKMAVRLHTSPDRLLDLIKEPSPVSPPGPRRRQHRA